MSMYTYRLCRKIYFSSCTLYKLWAYLQCWFPWGLWVWESGTVTTGNTRPKDAQKQTSDPGNFWTSHPPTPPYPASPTHPPPRPPVHFCHPPAPGVHTKQSYNRGEREIWIAGHKQKLLRNLGNRLNVVFIECSLKTGSKKSLSVDKSVVSAVRHELYICWKV